MTQSFQQKSSPRLNLERTWANSIVLKSQAPSKTTHRRPYSLQRERESLRPMTRCPGEYLQQPVAGFQAAILDGGPPGQDVLDVDGGAAADRDVSGGDAEAQALRT